MNISYKRDYTGNISGFSGQLDSGFSAEKILSETGYWSSLKRVKQELEYLVIDYKDIIIFDFIELAPSVNGINTFPLALRLEGSIDGDIWNILHAEEDIETDPSSYRIDIPLNRLRYLKLIITGTRKAGSFYYSEIGRCRIGISGIKNITATGFTQENVPENLFDGLEGTFWEAEAKKGGDIESLNIDLGKVIHLNRVILGSSDFGFPENFYLEASADKNVWVRLIDEKNFKAEGNKRYHWDFDAAAARFVKIDIKHRFIDGGKNNIRLSSMEIFSAVKNIAHTHNIGEMVSHSSIFQAGIVRLAKDGEESAGTVVQGSDRRLREGTTIFKGIVRLAIDGQEDEGVVVQALDSRLKPATELKPGIIRLGYDRENKSGVAVQCNDSRLREATINSFGIVKLCGNNIEAENSVVAGSDSRLRKATTDSHGICRLAKDGDSDPGSVVVAGDRRLRSATVNYQGIVELADDGEVIQGVAVQGNDRRLKDATVISKGIVELAEDGESSPGVAVQGNDRRLKDATTESRGIVELAEIGEVKPGAAVQSNDHRLKDATTETRGIVELADDGEDKGGVAVQGNDRRLKDAAETSKGIMRFSHDGEYGPFTAVQGNDRRLKDATTMSRGIVELAENGEDKEGAAVQGNDKRLKDASTETKGIVRLARDGEDKADVVVQSNDRRLKEATIHSKGILRFADNCEVSQFAAVQGNDARLKDATTETKGIIELAENGEDMDGVAVQGSDKRLKDATAISKGIVELAEDGEDSTGVVVQGNDKRLKAASEVSPGIVRLAKNGDDRGGLAVQSDDKRLSDPREPLPHVHQYAEIDHDFNSHAGTLSVREARNEPFTGITPPSDNSSVIHGKNSSGESGSIGITGVAGILNEKYIQSYGILGHSSHVGVRGQSVGGKEIKGCGVLGISRFGSGGVFSSEHGYSLVADGYGQIGAYEDGINLIGNGDALYVNGKSDFNGQVTLNCVKKGELYPANIVELFEIDDAEYISPGDILVASEYGGSILSRSKKEYNSAVIGIVSGNPGFILNNPESGKKLYPVTLAGRVLCNVDARNNPVNPGDLIVTSGTPGCGMKGKLDTLDKIGTVIGKALDKLEDGIDLIPVFITHL